MSVLTVIDAEEGSDAVVTTGHELANALEQEQIILHVVPDNNVKEQGKTAVEGVVEDTLGESEQPTIKIVVEASVWERDAPSDRIAEQITTEAEKSDVEYVVLGSRKRSPSGKAILGSVAQLVLINTATPVVIVEETG